MGRVDRDVAALAARYGLPDPAPQQLLSLLEVVAHDPLAPTTVRETARALDDHLADSLVALDLPGLRSARRIADLGSGAGFPGLPLAIALPTAEVVLVESSSRKCAFLERAAARAAAANVHVVHARAEAWPEGIDGCDLVTARALAPLGVVAEYAAPLLRIGGTLVAWRGQRDLDAEASAAAAAGELGLEVGPIRAVEPYPRAAHRHLHVFSKRAPTPARFPRRPGIARKRPLGSSRPTSDRSRR